MKFQVTLKTPDALDDAIREAVESDPELRETYRLADDAREYHEAVEEEIELTRKLAGRWFSYGEYLTVEIDTEAQTCKVME